MTYYLRQNDHGEKITGVCTDAAGAPVSISNATVRFLMQSLSGVPKVNAAASNDDSGGATVGHVSYTWLAADSLKPGSYLASWVVTYVAGTVQTFPNPGYVQVLITPQVVVLT